MAGFEPAEYACTVRDRCLFFKALEAEVGRLNTRVTTMIADLRMAHEEIGKLRAELKQLRGGRT